MVFNLQIFFYFLSVFMFSNLIWLFSENIYCVVQILSFPKCTYDVKHHLSVNGPCELEKNVYSVRRSKYFMLDI